MTLYVRAFEIVADGDRLLLRGRKTHVIVSLVAAPLLGLLCVGIAYANFVDPTAHGLQTFHDRPPEEKVATICIAGFMTALFGVVPWLCVITFVNRWLRPWMFDRRSWTIVHRRQCWPLDAVVSVRVAKGKTLNSATADVELILRDGSVVLVHRTVSGSGRAGTPLYVAVEQAIAIAAPIAEFLGLPLDRCG